MKSSNASATSTPNPAHHKVYFFDNHGRSPGDHVYAPICSNMQEEYGRIRRSRELGEACKVSAEGTPKRGSKESDEVDDNGIRKCGNGVIMPKSLP